jgi:hypothetical protein
MIKHLDLMYGSVFFLILVNCLWPQPYMGYFVFGMLFITLFVAVFFNTSPFNMKHAAIINLYRESVIKITILFIFLCISMCIYHEHTKIGAISDAFNAVFGWFVFDSNIKNISHAIRIFTKEAK